MTEQPHRPSAPRKGPLSAWGSALSALLVAGLAACQGRPPTTPTLHAADVAPATWSAAGGAARLDAWWAAFEDPSLDALVGEALASNPGLAEASARCRRAAAVARLEGAARRPSLDAVLGASATQARRRAGGRLDTNGDVTAGLGLEAGYELDLWGRLRSLHDAARLEARASASDRDAARIAVTASLATAWLRLRAAQEQMRLLAGQLTTNEHLLAVVQQRFEGGQAGAPDVLRQQQLIARTQAQSARTLVSIELLRHQVNALRGRPPRDPLPEVPAGLPALGPLPDTGLPLDSLRRRPDVGAAWTRLHAADRDLAAALADRAPRARLSARLETGGSDLAGLVREWLAAVAYDLVGPLADGGARDATVQAAMALRDERLAAYGRLVLAAAVEVEDALRGEALGRDVLVHVERQHDLARQTVTSLTARYGQGAADYFEVLGAVESEQALARALVDQQQELVERRVQLSRALAGPLVIDLSTSQERPGP